MANNRGKMGEAPEEKCDTFEQKVIFACLILCMYRIEFMKIYKKENIQ